MSLAENTLTTSSAHEAEQVAPSVFARVARRFVRHRLGMLGFLILLTIGASALLAPWLAPYDPSAIDYEALIAPPSAQFLLGTDELGRDILSRLIYGARISLEVVVVAIVLALVVGAAIGLFSGFAGGLLDNLIMRAMDGLLSFPLLVLALGIIAVLGPNLINAVIAIAIINIPGFARLVRGQVLAIRELDFVQAARALGASDLRIMTRHVWPSVAGNVIVYASLRASSALITESSLAFLGLGAEPPTPTWGQMLATSMEYWDGWWMSVFPGLAIFLAALAFNFVGDGLRDALDTRISD
jgi:ABC-type dipeptide/oligopeptide/nickel transport system permease subunit